MTDAIQRNRGSIRLWACGGMGANVGKKLEPQRNQIIPGTASLEITYADTSDGQVKGVDPKHTYIIPGTDGSGQVQAENAEEIIASVKDMLLNHKPGDVNVVLHSASGGSGAVFATALTKELLLRGCNVIVIMVGSRETEKFIRNARNTILNYEKIARHDTKQPVVAFHFENSPAAPRHVVDEAVVHVVGVLMVLASRQNTELDTRDLHNFLHFSDPRITKFGPDLVSLSLISNGDNLAALTGNIITVATLAAPGTDTSLDVRRSYQITGWLPPEVDADITRAAPLHFVITDSYFAGVGASLKKELDAYGEAADARREAPSIAGTADKATVGGFFYE